MPTKRPATALATECIKFGWETFQKRPWFFVGVTFLYFAINFLISFIGDSVSAVLGAGLGTFEDNAINLLLNFFLGGLLGLMTVVFLLKAHDALDHLQIEDAWQPTRYWSYLIVSVLMGLVTIGGIILLVIPGIIFALMFWFGGYIVVDQGRSPIEAMKESARITKGHKWELFLLGVASIGLVVIGFICLLVGMLVAVPVVTLAFTHAFRELQGASAIAPASSTTVP